MKNFLKVTAICILFFLLSDYASAQVGIGTENPHPSAALDLTSTTQGFLPPRMTQDEIYFLIRSSPAEGLLVYCTDCVPKGVYTFSNSSFKYIFSGKPTETIAQPVVSESSLVWMDRNLGATRVAETSGNQLSWGYMYQWGRGNDGHQRINWTSSTTTDGAEQTRQTNVIATTATPSHADFITNENGGNWTTFTGNTLWQDGVNDPCPTGYHVPTSVEFQAEINRLPIQNIFDAHFDLRLPEVGYRSEDGSIVTASNQAYYWTSTAVGSDKASFFQVNDSSASVSVDESDSFNRSRGLAIRCVKTE